MGLFDIFNKNKGKKEPKVEECFSQTGDLLGEIIDLASRYTIEDNLLDPSKLHQDVFRFLRCF